MDPVNTDIRARIVAAADQLFEEAGGESFPPVDAVRRLARADMNTTTAVMKEWRRQRIAASVVPVVAIPERIQQVQQAALAELWKAAQDLAAEQLAAARQAWEVERAEADAMRAELSAAFEAQAGELAAAQLRIVELEAAAAQAGQQLDQAREHARSAEIRATEIAHRAEVLQAELDRAHQAISERITAHEEAARLRGELDALRSQNAALLAMLQPGKRGSEA